MNLLLLIFFASSLQSDQQWLTDFDVAKSQASKENKLILLYFSGSDWCNHCMNAKKEIFDGDAFKKYAAAKLILLNADFPRKAENRLSDEQKSKNDALKKLYNRRGDVPVILLLSPDGKVLKKWKGMPSETPDDFVKRLIEAS